tara:strand:+ start:3109 stop:3708 length:600 start_codon:yes stop_codon:yes gene_type:complete
MKNFIIYDKKGGVKEHKTLNSYTYDNLYKLCGFKINDGFSKLFTYNSNNILIELFGKEIGKKSSENTHVGTEKFPFNRIEKNIYGNCILVASKDGEPYPINMSYINNINNIDVDDGDIDDHDDITKEIYNVVEKMNIQLTENDLIEIKQELEDELNGDDFDPNITQIKITNIISNFYIQKSKNDDYVDSELDEEEYELK